MECVDIPRPVRCPRRKDAPYQGVSVRDFHLFGRQIDLKVMTALGGPLCGLPRLR